MITAVGVGILMMGKFGDDMFTCHECGSEDNQPIVEEKTKDPFGLNAYAAELGKLRERR